MHKGRDWTTQEDEFLRLEHANYSVKALSIRFKCSLSCVRRRLNKLGLDRRVFSRADEGFFRRNWLNAPAEKIQSEFPHLPWEALHAKALSLGLMRFRFRKTQAQIRAIIVLHENGFKYIEIAETIKGLNAHEVKNYLYMLSNGLVE